MAREGVDNACFIPSLKSCIGQETKRLLRLDLEFMADLGQWSRSICHQFPTHTVGSLLIIIIKI